MFKVRLKDVRSFAKEKELKERLKAWQEEHHTSGTCNASDLGLECVAYSVGIYGCNGHIYRDQLTSELLGMPCRNEFIYIV